MSTLSYFLEVLDINESHLLKPRVVLNYKAKLFEKGLAESTVNRRLASIKTLCSLGRKLG